MSEEGTGEEQPKSSRRIFAAVAKFEWIARFDAQRQFFTIVGIEKQIEALARAQTLVRIALRAHLERALPRARGGPHPGVG